MKINKSIYLSGLLALALTSCKTAQTSYLQDLSTLKPIESADQLPARKSALAEKDLQRWSHLDILKDTIPGMSVDRAYEEIIKDKVGGIEKKEIEERKKLEKELALMTASST